MSGLTVSGDNCGMCGREEEEENRERRRENRRQLINYWSSTEKDILNRWQLNNY